MASLPRAASRATTALTHTFAAPAGATFNIRSTLIDGEPWFVAIDVCAALDMSLVGGTRQWLVGLAADEKHKATRRDHPELFSGTSGGSMNIISEPGLYALIGKSRKPAAAEFDRWVRHEVLPSIRKTGSYALADHGRTEMPVPAEFLTALREMTEAKLALAGRPRLPGQQFHRRAQATRQRPTVLRPPHAHKNAPASR